MAKIFTGGTTAQYDEAITYFGYRQLVRADRLARNGLVECAYCGKMNKPTTPNCEFCKAPLKEK